MRSKILCAAGLLFCGFLVWAPGARAAKEVAFSISGVDPVNVMRFKDPDTGRVRLGYVQSTAFSHTVTDGSVTLESVEDGIVYYGLMVEKLDGGRFQLDITYDFASPDGRTEGIRNRSAVDMQVLSAITPLEIETRAREHAAAFAEVMYDYFLKYRLEEETRRSLEIFMGEVIMDLLKTMPRDAMMLIRRWGDLSGENGQGQVRGIKNGS